MPLPLSPSLFSDGQSYDKDESCDPFRSRRMSSSKETEKDALSCDAFRGGGSFLKARTSEVEDSAQSREPFLLEDREESWEPFRFFHGSTFFMSCEGF